MTLFTDGGHRLVLEKKDMLGKPGPGTALDDCGYELLRGLDESALEVPQIHDRMTIKSPHPEFDKGFVTIIDRAPEPFRNSEFRAPDGKTTKGQVEAYQRGVAEANNNGIVIADGHGRNWFLRPLDSNDTGADEWVYGPLDTGAAIEIRGRNPVTASAMQNAIDAPDADPLAKIEGKDWTVMGARGSGPSGAGTSGSISPRSSTTRSTGTH